MALINAICRRSWSISQTLLRNNVKLGLSAFRNHQIADHREAFIWQSRRTISLGACKCSAETEVAEEGGDEEGEAKEGIAKTKVDPAKDRSKKILPEVSIRYMESDSYKETYKTDPVWKLYKRNHKYAFAPKKTRATCVKNDTIVTGNPCPICRDEYLVLDYRNVKLLKQFISPYSDEVIDPFYTGVCRKKHFDLLVAVEKARDIGYIPFHVPKRYYNYDEYYPKMDKDDC